MYTQYFGLKENPFALPPDPRYLYLGLRHQEALAHLMYGVKGGGGFVQLTGEVGTGKTTMVRALVERLPDTVDVALVLYPFLSVREFIVAILDDLGIEHAGQVSLKAMIDALNAYLLENHAKGRRNVLIVDEAHKLNRELLEQIRLLTNLETTKEKLLQIILVGQPELASLLAQPDLRQLAQRITARYNLKPLLPRETTKYVLHRLHVAGVRVPLFTYWALRRVHHLSGGIPRLINIICDRALLGAYARGRNRVGMVMVNRAAREVETSAGVHHGVRRVALAGATTLVAGAAAFAGWWFAPDVIGRVLQKGSTTPAITASLKAPTANGVEMPAKSEPQENAKTAVSKEPGGVATKAAPALEQLLVDPAVPTDTDSAFATLFAYWRFDYTQFIGLTGCERAEKAGLRCFFDSGTWNNLRQLNRPAIIELIDQEGSRHHVVVSHLTRDTVTLELNGKPYEFPLSKLDRYWFGKYLALWSVPETGERVVRRGMRGPSVVWVRDALARYGLARISQPNSDVFDTDLESLVKQFQRRNQLDDDGVVGKMTLIYLSTYDATMSAPLLSAQQESATR